MNPEDRLFPVTASRSTHPFQGCDSSQQPRWPLGEFLRQALLLAPKPGMGPGHR